MLPADAVLAAVFGVVASVFCKEAAPVLNVVTGHVAPPSVHSDGLLPVRRSDVRAREGARRSLVSSVARSCARGLLRRRAQNGRRGT